MDWGIIISENENINEIYESLGKELKTYLSNMRAKVSSVEGLVSSLSSGWSGTDYNIFKKDMEKAMSRITECLDRGDSLYQEVKGAQKDLAEDLALLRTKYGS